MKSTIVLQGAFYKIDGVIILLVVLQNHGRGVIDGYFAIGFNFHWMFVAYAIRGPIRVFGRAVPHCSTVTTLLFFRVISLAVTPIRSASATETVELSSVARITTKAIRRTVRNLDGGIGKNPIPTIGEIAADVSCCNLRVFENELTRLRPSSARLAGDGGVAEAVQSYVGVVQRQGRSVLHVQTVGSGLFFFVCDVQCHILQSQCSIGGNRDGVTVLGLGVDFELTCPSMVMFWLMLISASRLASFSRVTVWLSVAAARAASRVA